MNKHDGLSKHAYDNDAYEHAKTCNSEVCEPFHKRGHKSHRHGAITSNKKNGDTWCESKTLFPQL